MQLIVHVYLVSGGLEKNKKGTSCMWCGTSSHFVHWTGTLEGVDVHTKSEAIHPMAVETF